MQCNKADTAMSDQLGCQSSLDFIQPLSRGNASLGNASTSCLVFMHKTCVMFYT